MSEPPSKPPFSVSPLNLPQLLIQVYGPYAFGVSSLLLIWFAIVKPELTSRDIQWDSHSQVLKTQQEIVITMQSTAASMQMTAAIMERTVEKIESMNHPVPLNTNGDGGP